MFYDFFRCFVDFLIEAYYIFTIAVHKIIQFHLLWLQTMNQALKNINLYNPIDQFQHIF